MRDRLLRLGGRLASTNVVSPDTAPPPPSSAAPVVTGIIDMSDHICICGNRRLTSFMNVKGANMLGCPRCGSFFSDMVGALRNPDQADIAPPYQPSDIEDMERFVRENRAGLISGGIPADKIAVATDHPDMQAPNIVRLTPRSVEVDSEARFQAIILPDLASHIAFPARTLIGLSQMLVTGGILVFRARSAAHPDLNASAMGASPVVRPSSQFHFPSRDGLETMFRNSPFRKPHLMEADGFWLIGQAVNGPRVLDVGIFSGIGDVLWSIVLVPSLLARYGVEKLRVFVNDPGGDTARRSNALLERFEFVEAVIPARFDIHPPELVDPETGYLNYLPAGPVAPEDYSSAAPFTYRFIVNSYLEQGHDFAETARSLDLDPALLDYDVFSRYLELPPDTQGADKLTAHARSGFAVFYLSSRRMNSTEGFNRGGLWRVEDWAALGRKLHDRFGFRIVITGAAYDLDYLQDFVRACGDDFHDIYINIVGQYNIVETREILKRARFIVGYPSGIPIMGTFLGTPTAMFWRPRHLSLIEQYAKAGFDPAFARVWVPPAMLASGRYIDLWFGEDTPDTVHDKIVAAGW